MIFFIVVLSTILASTNSKPSKQTDDVSKTTTERAQEIDRAKTIAIYVLASGLCFVSSLLLYVLLRKRCKKITWKPNKTESSHREEISQRAVSTPMIEEKSEAIFSTSTPNPVTVSKDENQAKAEPVSKASNSTETKPPGNLTLTNSSDTATTKVSPSPNLPSPSRQIPDNIKNDDEQSPPPMSSTKLRPANAKSLEDIPEESQNIAEIKAPLNDYKLNMMKNCFGEAFTKANSKKAFKPRPTSVSQENDLYVSADNVEDVRPVLRSNLDAPTNRTPVIRPPTAFISDIGDTNALGDEEYDFPKNLRPLSHVANGENNVPTKSGNASDKEVEAEEDYSYDFPSETLRKISLTDGLCTSADPDDGYKAPKHTYRPSDPALHLYGNCVPAPKLTNTATQN